MRYPNDEPVGVERRKPLKELWVEGAKPGDSQTGFRGCQSATNLAGGEALTAFISLAAERSASPAKTLTTVKSGLPLSLK